jgi:RNA polymerase sigma-70 factor (ECF subfamily)
MLLFCFRIVKLYVIRKELRKNDMNEEKIIKNCQNSNLKEFTFLYEKYIRKIYDFVYYKTHHKETAEDLVSLVFMKALEKIGSFDLEKGTFQAWLYQIARNTVIDHYRTRKKDRNIEDVWDLAGDEDLARDLDTREKLKQVEKYLKNIKSEHRDIIIMRVWQGLGHAEIAQALGKSEASIKMIYSRAIRKLRKEMPLAIYILFLLGL